MLRCRICDVICDPSDLVNGVCDDCREVMRLRQENREKVVLMANSNGKQMTFDDLETWEWRH